MPRAVHDEDHVHPDARERVASYHSEVVQEVRAAVGVEFYDRRSALHYRFRERLAGQALRARGVQRADRRLHRCRQEGRCFFDYVQDVATKLGRWPVLAVAAVLAAIDVPRRRAGHRVRDHDPYAAESLK